MRLLLKLQLILLKIITNIYKSDYYWDQFTSMLMELYPDFNPHKYSRDVYSSLLGKEEDYLHSILIKKRNTPTMHLWGFELLPSSNLEGSRPDHSAFGRVPWYILHLREQKFGYHLVVCLSIKFLNWSFLCTP